MIRRITVDQGRIEFGTEISDAERANRTHVYRTRLIVLLGLRFDGVSVSVSVNDHESGGSPLISLGDCEDEEEDAGYAIVRHAMRESFLAACETRVGL